MTSADKSQGADFRMVVPIDSIPPEGWRGTIEAPAAALAQIAARIHAPKLIRLRSEVELRPVASGFRLSGVLDAALVRECVVSLEAVDEIINETFEITFSKSADAETVIDLDPDADAPEPLEESLLDLAEILVQQLVLAMDPYPRKPGATSLADSFGGAERTSPFEILKSTIAGTDEQR